jgi:hypothetical protein
VAGQAVPLTLAPFSPVRWKPPRSLRAFAQDASPHEPRLPRPPRTGDGIVSRAREGCHDRSYPVTIGQLEADLSYHPMCMALRPVQCLVSSLNWVASGSACASAPAVHSAPLGGPDPPPR